MFFHGNLNMVTCICCIAVARDSLSFSTVKVLDVVVRTPPTGNTRFGLLYVPCWCWLELFCSLFLHLEFHFGSGVCFWNTLPTYAHLPCFGSCTLRARELNLFWVQLNTKIHLRDAPDAGQLLTGVRFLGQKKACSEYMALPHCKIYIVWMSILLYRFDPIGSCYWLVDI